MRKTIIALLLAAVTFPLLAIQTQTEPTTCHHRHHRHHHHRHHHQ